jgi:hypothetical protein
MPLPRLSPAASLTVSEAAGSATPCYPFDAERDPHNFPIAEKPRSIHPFREAAEHLTRDV